MNQQQSETHVIELTEGTFRAAIVEDKGPILVDFWAPWCGPCRMMKPFLAEAAATLSSEVRVASLNVDEAQPIAEAFGIRGIPTLILIKDGKILDSVSGVMPAAGIVSRVRAALAKDANTAKSA